MRRADLEQLTEALMMSYERHPTLPDQGEPLPSLDEMIEVMDEVKRLLFPGFYAAETLSVEARSHSVAYWLSRLHQRLSRLLNLALRHERAQGNEGVSCCLEEAGELSTSLLSRIRVF